MQQTNPAPEKTREIQIVAGLKVVETEYRVQVPVFTEVQIDKPVFVETPLAVPTEWDKTIEEMTHRIADKIMDKIELVLSARLDRAIDQRIKEIKSPKIVEELNIIHKDVNVERPIFTDVKVDRPVFVDYEIKNPIVKDVEVINAVVVDRTVVNAIITDQKMTNAIIKDVEVERAVIRDKVLDVIHPRYLKLNGEPE